MSFNIEDIFDSDALESGREFRAKVFPKINKNFLELKTGINSNFLPNSGGTINGQLYITTISGGTFFSGSTPLETIISSLAGPGGSSTYVQNGLNTYTGGTTNLPTVNVSGASLDNIFVSGSSRFNVLTGGTISGDTFFSGSTLLGTIINNIAAQYSAVTYVQNGLNTYTGGTSELPTVNISSATLNNLVATGSSTFQSVTANTLYVNQSSGGNVVLTADTNATLKTINFVVNGSGVAITTGAKGIVQVPFSGTLINWKLISDASTTTTVDIWKTNNSIPTNSNSIIGAGTKPSLSSGTVANSNVDWTTTSVSVNDVFRMEVESNNNSTYLSLVLTVKVY